MACTISIPLAQADVRLHDRDDVLLLVVHVIDKRGGQAVQRGGQPVTRVRSRPTTPYRQFPVDLRVDRIDPTMLLHDAQHDAQISCDGARVSNSGQM